MSRRSKSSLLVILNALQCSVKMGVEKLLRPFQKSLSQEELELRKNGASAILGKVRNLPEWSNWISGARLFGSTARGTPKSGSDVDIAIFTNQSKFAYGEFDRKKMDLQIEFDSAQRELGIYGYKYHVVIIPNDWYYTATGEQKKFYENIQREGIQIY